MSSSAPPVSLTLDRALRQALVPVRTGQGELSATASLRGVELVLGYKPKAWLSVSGYAGRQWRGAWDAGARAAITWGAR